MGIIIVEQPTKHEVFSVEPGRKLKHFNKTKDLFSTASKKDLLEWMVSKLSCACFANYISDYTIACMHDRLIIFLMYNLLSLKLSEI